MYKPHILHVIEKKERDKEEVTRQMVKEERKVKSHKSLPSLYLFCIYY